MFPQESIFGRNTLTFDSEQQITEALDELRRFDYGYTAFGLEIEATTKLSKEQFSILEYSYFTEYNLVFYIRVPFDKLDANILLELALNPDISKVTVSSPLMPVDA